MFSRGSQLLHQLLCAPFGTIALLTTTDRRGKKLLLPATQVRQFLFGNCSSRTGVGGGDGGELVCACAYVWCVCRTAGRIRSLEIAKAHPQTAAAASAAAPAAAAGKGGCFPFPFILCCRGRGVRMEGGGASPTFQHQLKSSRLGWNLTIGSFRLFVCPL